MGEMTTRIRFFTIADFSEEETWLREQHNAGWKLVKIKPPCFYQFEKCEPEDVIYRLDFKNNCDHDDYLQILEDYGWEYFDKCFGWMYFRKPASETSDENDGELFSDTESRIELLNKVIRTRILPLVIIFLCCVLPNMTRTFSGSFGVFFTTFWAVMFFIYTYIIFRCGFKLRKMKKELESAAF